MERPILFSTDMVQALLAGRKTQTRRILKVKGCKAFIPHSSWSLEEIKRWNKEYHPYGKVGDLLYVRETWNENDNKFYFRASPDTLPRFIKNGISDGDFKFEDCIWKPSIHMPKTAARIWLKITNVRVERLKDISKEDAVCEGVFEIEKDEAYKDYMKESGSYAGPIGSFFSLWESINGLDSLLANPWVWVVEFEVVSTTGIKGVKEAK